MLLAIKIEEQMKMTDLTIKQLATRSKYEGLGAATAAELVIGFWFGIGVILAVRTVNSLDYCVKALKTRNKGYCY